MTTMNSIRYLPQRERDILDFLNGHDLFNFDKIFSKGGTVQEILARTRNTAKVASFDAAGQGDGVDCEGEPAVASEIIENAECPAPTIALAPTESVNAAAKASVVTACAEPSYGFPKKRGISMSTSEMRQALEELTKRFNLSGNYALVRDDFCAISIALNEQGLWAPKFRPQPKISPVAPKTHMNMVLNRDHLVIDAHWLWANEQLPPSPVAYENLLDYSQPFDFASAAAYAQENWMADFRAEGVFFLPLAVQWQLCKTHTVDLVDRYRALTYGDRAGKTKIPALVNPVRKAINTWARSRHQIRGEEKAYEHLWLAREMLGVKAAAKDIGVLAGLMSGKLPLDPSTVREKLRRLDARLSA